MSRPTCQSPRSVLPGKPIDSDQSWSQRAEAATPEELEERLLEVARWLLAGQSGMQAVTLAQARWGIGRRMAQVYVQRVRRRMAREAAREERLFYLRLSQLQRDQLLQGIFRYTQRPDQLSPQEFTRLVAVARALLESRDKTATAIHELTGYRKPTPAQLHAETRQFIAETKRLVAQGDQALERERLKLGLPSGRKASGGRQPPGKALTPGPSPRGRGEQEAGGGRQPPDSPRGEPAAKGPTQQTAPGPSPANAPIAPARPRPDGGSKLEPRTYQAAMPTVPRLDALEAAIQASQQPEPPQIVPIAICPKPPKSLSGKEKRPAKAETAIAPIAPPLPANRPATPPPG